ncbi:MAG TPA: type II toxin-antitoxin system PemK/MazF family toxin, partial [Methanolinea sp.]|nr:type II toxin-antitoxin system PemK/MazF family toxin [Methanolinea sp.]
GDVILARIRIGERGEPKVRPAIVVKTGDDGCIHAFPVSSAPSRDQRAVPVGLEDFQEGGLDIMDESYVLTGTMVRIAARDVAGKKGRLTPVALDAILPRK